MDLTNQSIMITGGTGSFGNKFIEVMLAEYHPGRLTIDPIRGMIQPIDVEHAQGAQGTLD